jgi:YfiH family protein
LIKSFLLSRHTEIAHFCTSREGGVSVGNYASNNLSPFAEDNAADFRQNQHALCEFLGIEPSQLIIPYQIHGAEIRVITGSFSTFRDDEKAAFLHGVDALITDIPDICIGVTTADCVPLLFFDPKQQVIAAAHAGWRGTRERIAAKTINSMTGTYKCRTEDILVFIGPSISPKVYEVGKEVVQRFENEGFDIQEIVEFREDACFLDLWKANRIQLEESGVLPRHIEIAELCTYTLHDRFFSARRLGIRSGRMLNGIMLKQ